MTTQPQSQPQPETARIPITLPDDFVCPDPEPWDMLQAPTIAKTGYFVARHFRAQPNTLVTSAGIVYYDRYDMNRKFEPDLLVAFDVDVPAIRARNGYIFWEAGKPPDFVLEVASPSTHARDTGFKRRLYAELGIGESWRVDPTGGDYYGYAIAGDEMTAPGVYRDRPIHREPDGMLWGYSPMLDLCLCWHPAWDWDVDDDSNLRFYDRKTERYLCDISLVEGRLAVSEASLQIANEQLAYTHRHLSAEQQTRQSTEAQLHDEQAARQLMEAQLHDEQAARAAAEARIRELEERLRRQQP